MVYKFSDSVPTPVSENSDYIPIEMQSDTRENNTVESAGDDLSSNLDNMWISGEKNAMNKVTDLEPHYNTEGEDHICLDDSSIAQCDKVIEIAPDGDVALCVDSKVLLVSSKILRMASAVFNKMMSDARIDPDATVILHLEDDDPDALVLLCRLLHHQLDGISEAHPGLHMLLNFVELAKKYECLPPVQFQASYWLRSKAGSLRRLSFEDKKKVYSAACLLGNEDEFQSISMETMESLKEEELESLLLDLNPSARPIAMSLESYMYTQLSR